MPCRNQRERSEEQVVYTNENLSSEFAQWEHAESMELQT